MVQSKTYLLLLSTVFFFGSICAQEKYQVINWNTDHGLIWNRANWMLKDKRGFLWITSEFGLNRFDGNRFTDYFPDKNKPGAIGGAFSNALIEDSLNNIWIGTDQGLTRYDISSDTFQNFLPDPVRENPNSVIIPFWASREEVYCIESHSMITAYNIHTFQKRSAATLKFSINGFAARYSILDTASNSVWMLPASEDGIMQVFLSSGEITHHKRSKDKDVSHYYRAFNEESMCYDKKRGCIWINSHDGLIQFTLNDKKFHYTYTTNAFLNRKEYDRWAGVDIDQAGRIWMPTISKGLLMYDPETNAVILPIDPVLQKKVSEGNFYIYHDRDGIIWTSSWLKTGIHQLIPYRQSVTRYDATELHPKRFVGTIPQIVPAGNGLLWISSENGLVVLDQNTGSVQLLQEKDLPGIKGKDITPLFVNTSIQKAWLNAWNPDDPAAPDAIFEMDIKSRKCRPLILRDEADRVVSSRNTISYTAHAYKNGFIYLDAGHGIFFVNRDSAVAKLVIPRRKNGFLYLVDSNKLILNPWIGNPETYSDVNGKWVLTPGRLDSMEWGGLYYDKTDRSWWVGRSRELLHYDQDFRILNRYDEKAGLPELEIHDILPDNYGNLWFRNTEGIISRLNPKSGNIITLTERDGFQKQFFQWHPHFIRDESGIFYFAGQEGVDRIDPGKLPDYPPSSAYLVSLNINQKAFPLKTGINNIQELSLRYFENMITIETGVVDYYSKGKSLIRYKLEGLNEDWEYAPANYTIRLGKLAPRNYRLLIQASNASNEFNGPIKSLLIHISPAFWNTWWFRVAAVLLAAGIFYGFIRWRVHQKFILELERTEKEKQMVAFQRQKTELEMQALRAQMNPHFIFNSLNSINRFILQNNKTQASEYLTKFSKLVRMILQNSQESLITLENELETLKLYLELEALRFENRFDFKISVPKDVDIDVLKVPPLIIQPYVENAIWHGLMHKEEKGHLSIDADQKDDQLFLRITDNGIGRKQASQLARKSTVPHKSMGLKITSDRIKILHRSTEAESPVTINDLVHADGSAAGTEVLLKLPVQLV